MQWMPLVPEALPRIKSSCHPQGIFQPWPPNALDGTAQETRGWQHKPGYLIGTANQNAFRFCSYLSMDQKCRFNSPQPPHNASYVMASYSTGMHHAEAEWELARRAQGSLPTQDSPSNQAGRQVRSNINGLPNYPQLLVELRKQQLLGMKQRANTWEGKRLAGYISEDHLSHRNWLLIPCFPYAEVFIPEFISSCSTRDSTAQSNRQYMCLPLTKSR